MWAEPAPAHDPVAGEAVSRMKYQVSVLNQVLGVLLDMLGNRDSGFRILSCVLGFGEGWGGGGVRKETKAELASRKCGQL